ncbi:uncharacterized protein L203_101349 [Cryptococcus depauperatus CBS 7841]|uniref:Uncharacterized protein n=1 Tax=Cryptococcus depauperatus CBS 7841 TaxID=1295531 RepID=A0A1E3IC38_9TREE|nr:protein GET1 [Cryptococcus depauperatus CBS 7841]
MFNLAVLVFLIVLLTQVISWIGHSAVQELAFLVYYRICLSGTASAQNNIRKQVLEDKAELGKTSSQDEFAKWAKLKRKLDKGLADLEKINTTLSSSRSSFSRNFSFLIWLLTTGAQFFLVWWYRKQPVFWLPEGWVPYPVAWVLSFPNAPIGAVSAGTWCAVCKRVLQSLQEIAQGLVQPSSPAVPVSTSATQAEQKEVPMTIEHEKLD